MKRDSMQHSVGYVVNVVVGLLLLGVVILPNIVSAMEGKLLPVMPQAPPQGKPGSIFIASKEILFEADKSRWISAFIQDDGTQAWLTEKYLHKVLAMYRGRFAPVASYSLPSAYQSKVGLITGYDEINHCMRMLLVPKNFEEGSTRERIIEVSLTLSTSFEGGAEIDWKLERELDLPPPPPTHSDEHSKGQKEEKGKKIKPTEWKYLIQASKDSSSSSDKLHTLYLISKDRVVYVDYKKWSIINEHHLPQANFFAAAVTPRTLYLASHSRTESGDVSEVYQIRGIKKHFRPSRFAVIPHKHFNELRSISWNHSPASYSWLYKEADNDSVFSTIASLQEAAAVSAPQYLPSNVSIIFADPEQLPFEFLLAHGPIDPRVAKGGYIVRRMKTRPSVSLSTEMKLVDFNALPSMIVHMRPLKNNIGRAVMGTTTKKGALQLVYYTYKLDKEDKKKEQQKPETTITPATPVTTNTQKQEETASTTNLNNNHNNNDNNINDNKGTRKLLELDPLPASRNATLVNMNIIFDDEPADYDPTWPFSCKPQGCGPDVACPSVTPTTECFLYNDAFLCCHQSPFG